MKERILESLGSGILSFLEFQVDLQLEGRENIPQNEGTIVVFNHASDHSQLPLLGALAVMAAYPGKKEDLVPIISSDFAPYPARIATEITKRLRIETIAVKSQKREIPIPVGLIKAKKLLDQGKTIFVSPEGKAPKVIKLAAAKLGTAWLALKTGANILPVGIEFGEDDSYHNFLIPKKCQLRVQIGQSFQLDQIPKPTKEQLQQATTKIMASIAALLPPEMRGEYESGKIEP